MLFLLPKCFPLAIWMVSIIAYIKVRNNAERKAQASNCQDNSHRKLQRSFDKMTIDQNINIVKPIIFRVLTIVFWVL